MDYLSSNAMQKAGYFNVVVMPNNKWVHVPFVTTTDSNASEQLRKGNYGKEDKTIPNSVAEAARNIRGLGSGIAVRVEILSTADGHVVGHLAVHAEKLPTELEQAKDMFLAWRNRQGKIVSGLWEVASFNLPESAVLLRAILEFASNI